MIEVRGAQGVHRMLQAWMEPILPRRMQEATKAGATVFKAPLQAEARKVSSRMARAVSVRKARRDTPATIVSFRGKNAWFRHWVIGGTKAHGPRKAEFLRFIPNWNPYFRTRPPAGASSIRARRVRGVPPNPMVARVAQRHEREALSAIDRSLDRSEA